MFHFAPRPSPLAPFPYYNQMGQTPAHAAHLEQPVGLNTFAISLGDVRYPTALAAIHDPPPTLWVCGQLDVLHTASVAVVGSRAASPYGLEVSRRLGADLARRNLTIVSGMARGIDSAAHRGALEAAGATIAVFGCGVDVIYPPEHGALALRICERGALVSEFPPGMPPLKHNFPRRNRIISGLSLAVVVVEAAEGSGSLITADFALEQGRAVLAVPGNVLGGRNYGAHALLRDGAKLVECADDIVEELPPGFRAEGSRLRSAEESKPGNPASQDPVLRSMTEGDAYDLDEIAERSGIDRLRLLPRLLELELAGAVQRVEGGRFIRFHGPC
jgi:DNA processing protein